MFSLIITIISIALVAALALASLYYGGSAFNQGAAKADASKILLQGQQLMGAADLYNAERGVYPASIAVMLSEGYLKAIPVVQRDSPGLVGSVQAQLLELDKTWKMPVAGSPVFVVRPIGGVDTCSYVNLQGSLAKMGILKQAQNELVSQCYGSDAVPLTVVFKKTVDTPLAPALPVAELATSSLSSIVAASWFREPATASSSSGGLSISSNSFTFEGTRIGRAKVEVIATLTNTSNAPINVGRPINSDYNTFYSFLGDDCVDSEGYEKPLAPGKSCSIMASFYPGSLGAHTRTIGLSTSTGDSTLTISGTGVAVTPGAEIVSSHTYIRYTNFESSYVPLGLYYFTGFESLASLGVNLITPPLGGTRVIDVTLTNIGMTTASIGSIAFSDELMRFRSDTHAAAAAREGFSVTHSCPAQLAQNESCTYRVTYSPVIPNIAHGINLLVKDPQGNRLTEINTLAGFTEIPPITYFTYINSALPNLNTASETYLGVLPANVPYDVPLTLTNVTPYSARVELVGQHYDGITGRWVQDRANLVATGCPEFLGSGESCALTWKITPLVPGTQTLVHLESVFNGFVVASPKVRFDTP